MISMSVDVAWSIVLNTTELKFYQVQERIKKMIAEETLHCLPRGKMDIIKENVTVEGVTFDVYCRLHEFKLEFAVIEREESDFDDFDFEDED